MVNGTDLGSQYWCDALFLRYLIDPTNLPNHCDGCNAKFSIFHTLDCMKGGLITNCHNEIHNGVADLSGKACIPSHVRENPLIHKGCAVQEGKDYPELYPPTIHQILQKTRITRKTFSPSTSKREGQILLTTYVL